MAAGHQREAQWFLCRYLPKASDIADLTGGDLTYITTEINNHPLTELG